MNAQSDVEYAMEAMDRFRSSPRLKVLFVLEGFSDIRFVAGLAEICELSLLVPSRQYRSSWLDQRIAEAGVTATVIEVNGGRWQYQLASFGKLWAHADRFDVILSQELLRGSLNSCLIGRLKGKPTVAIMTLPSSRVFSLPSQEETHRTSYQLCGRDAHSSPDGRKFQNGDAVRSSRPVFSRSCRPFWCHAQPFLVLWR
jgi:hypothetical protein